MLIALNLLYLIPGVVGGTETYARSLIHALAAEDADNEYVVFLNKESADLDVTPGPNFRRVVCPFIAHRRAVRYVWEQAALPLQLLKASPDLVHNLGYVGPLAARCPQVVTVHDLNYLGHTGRRSAVGRRAFRFFVESSIWRANRVITISRFSRDEIVRHLHIAPEKVTVIHSAGREISDSEFGERMETSETVRNVNRPFVMAFSSLSAHKNIPRLIAAFAQISPDIPHSLVLVGHLPEKSDVRAEIESAGSDRIRFTGYLPDEDVRALMRDTSLFVFPSVYEGFGLPILDAQHAGVPVACSSAAALPEVAGDGALLFDPLSVDDIARALGQALFDMDLRESLVKRGRENARRFSWHRAARETLDVYSSVTQ